MKRFLSLFVIIVFLLLLFSCATKGIKKSETNNPEITVTVLFEYDGIRIYRFKDVGDFHYFAKDISGNVMTMNKISETSSTTYYYDNYIYTIKSK